MKNKGLKLGIGCGLTTIFGGIVWGGFIADTQVCQATSTPNEFVIYTERTQQTLATMTVTPQEGAKTKIGHAVVDPSLGAPSRFDILSVEEGNGYCALHLNDAPYENRATILFPLLLGLRTP